MRIRNLTDAALSRHLFTALFTKVLVDKVDCAVRSVMVGDDSGHPVPAVLVEDLTPGSQAIAIIYATELVQLAGITP